LLPRYEALYASVLGIGAAETPDVLERLEVAA
jgi:hypothetical protein